MSKTVLLLFCVVSTTVLADNYFKVLIREIDNPAGTLLSGNACSDFNYLGLGCNNYIQAAVSASGVNVSNQNTLDSITLINSRFETRLSDLNIEVADEKASGVDEFRGFDVHIKLATDTSFSNVIDSYTFHVDTTASQGVYTYTHPRDNTLATTVSIAWATNIAPPSTSTTAEPFTGSTASQTPTEEPTTAPKLPTDCDEVANKTTGPQTVYPDGVNGVTVYCEQTDNGAYTVIQSRGSLGSNDVFNTTVLSDFYPSFGEPGVNYNYWFGLDNMHALSTNGKDYSLQIDLCCGSSLVKRQFYHKFGVGGSDSQYTLTATADVPGVGLDYKSTVTDIGAPFSVHDNYTSPAKKNGCDQFEYADDHDNEVKYYGGWWFGSCGNNLNGYFYANNDGNCAVTKFAQTGLLGVNMRTTSGTADGGWDVDLISYDRVRMALFTFDSLSAAQTDDSFCTQ